MFNPYLFCPVCFEVDRKAKLVHAMLLNPVMKKHYLYKKTLSRSLQYITNILENNELWYYTPFNNAKGKTTVIFRLSKGIPYLT